MDRRGFIGNTLLAAAASVYSALLPPLAKAALASKRILILGGTLFLGPAIVEAAIAEGHTVTLFNRGVTNPDLFPHQEKLRGFRSANVEDQNLAALSNRRFDAVIDVWPNDPSIAASAAELLKDRTSHYLYVSSVGAYDPKEFSHAGIEETAPLEPWDAARQNYSRGKAESERRLRAILGEKLTVVRPGPIKGSRDDTPDLLTWLVRAQNGGRHIGPGDGSDPVELVDVKDVARFLMQAIDRSLFGAFNLAGKSMTFREFLNACNAAVHSDAQFVWIPRDFLRQHQLETDSALKTFAGYFPHWRPAGEQQGLYQVSSEKAFRAGWHTRAFEETALDCLSTFRSLNETLDWQDYLPADKEKEVLDAWDHHAS